MACVARRLSLRAEKRLSKNKNEFALAKMQNAAPKRHDGRIIIHFVSGLSLFYNFHFLPCIHDHCR